MLNRSWWRYNWGVGISLKTVGQIVPVYSVDSIRWKNVVY